MTTSTNTAVALVQPSQNRKSRAITADRCPTGSINDQKSLRHRSLGAYQLSRTQALGARRRRQTCSTAPVRAGGNAQGRGRHQGRRRPRADGPIYTSQAASFTGPWRRDAVRRSLVAAPGSPWQRPSLPARWRSRTRATNRTAACCWDLPLSLQRQWTPRIQVDVDGITPFQCPFTFERRIRYAGYRRWIWMKQRRRRLAPRRRTMGRLADGDAHTAGRHRSCTAAHRPARGGRTFDLLPRQVQTRPDLKTCRSAWPATALDAFLSLLATVRQA